MAKDYSEDLLIQKSTAELLEKELGWKSVGNGGGSVENSGESKLTERQRFICDAIKTNGNVTAKTLEVSAITIERELNFLRKEGYITKEGKSNKGVRNVL